MRLGRRSYSVSHSTWFIFVSSILVLVTIPKWKGCNGCWEDERIGLLRLNSSLYDPIKLSGGSVQNSNEDCCQWHGVGCDPATGRVTDLNLGGFDYNATSSRTEPLLDSCSLLRFQELRVLSVYSFHILGCMEKNKGWPHLESLRIFDSSFASNNFLETIGTVMTNLTYLSIQGSSLNSTIPKAFCNLLRLRQLDFTDNNLWGELPQCLSNLTSLRSLSMVNNEISGDISESPIPHLVSLVEITIYGNLIRIPISLSPFFNHSCLLRFSADICRQHGDHHTPVQQGKPLFQLIELDLSSPSDGGGGGGGGYVGPFPEFLYHKTNLLYLRMSKVEMKGDIGFLSWFPANNTNLKVFYLLNCSLSGHFQIPIHPHKNLMDLDISNNGFISGLIPPNICTIFPNIESLSLSGNKFFGKIPPQLSNCSFFHILEARNNQLTGEIPKEIWDLPMLSILDLSKNKLSGNLPPGFVSPWMQEVYLSRNQLRGTLTTNLSYQLGDFSASSSTNYTGYWLGVLDLSHNRFTGTIAEWISRLPRLSYILLNDNQFHGEVPVSFCLENSKLIDLSHNHLSGHLTSKIFTSNIINCNARVAFSKPNHDMEFVTKTLLYTYKGVPLQLISGMDFSNNNLTGDIPLQIGHLGNIKVLNLSYNKFTGPIPPTIANMSQIESLDLSHNNLSGVIPLQLTELHSLSSFSVAYNNLSGNCPQKIAQFSTFDENSYQGNLFLNCTLPLLTPLRPTTSDDGYDDGEDGFIDMESFYASSGVSFIMVLLIIASVLYVNPYWKQAWFYYVGVTVTTCYYFVVDHLHVPTRYKVWELHI